MVVMATRHGNEVEFNENIDLIYDGYLEEDDGDLYLDLGTSLFFQKLEFDTRVSSHGMNDTIWLEYL